MKRLVPILIIAFSIPACGTKPLPESELFGLYTLVSTNLAGSLELKSDHTYHQVYRSPDGSTQSADGKWEYTVSKEKYFDEATVDLYGAIIERREKLVKQPPDHLLVLPVSANWKQISLFLEPDGNCEYVKPKP